MRGKRIVLDDRECRAETEIPPQDPAELAWRAEPAHREAFIPVTRTHFEIPAIWSIYDASRPG